MYLSLAKLSRSALPAAIPRGIDQRDMFKANRMKSVTANIRKYKRGACGTYSLFSTRNDLGDMQLTLHSVFPCSLHIVMENLPQFARIRWISFPSPHSISSVLPSQAYAVSYLSATQNAFCYFFFFFACFSFSAKVRGNAHATARCNCSCNLQLAADRMQRLYARGRACRTHDVRCGRIHIGFRFRKTSACARSLEDRCRCC